MAVFTPISSETMLSIRNAYGLEDIFSLIGLADGDSETTYLAISGRRQIVITLFESAVEPHDLERAFQTMEILAAAGVPCPATIRTPSGAPCVVVAGRTMALVEGVPGNPDASPDAARCLDLGRNMARIHTALLAANPLHRVERHGLPCGWLHGALGRDNVFFVGDVVTGIINFRLRRQGLLVDEIADALAEWCLIDDAPDPGLCAALLKGYAAGRPLADRERDRLPIILASQVLRRATMRDEPTETAIHRVARTIEILHEVCARAHYVPRAPSKPMHRAMFDAE